MSNDKQDGATATAAKAGEAIVIARNPMENRAFELREATMVQTQDEKTGEIKRSRKTELLGTFETEEAIDEYERFRYPASGKDNVGERMFERRQVKRTKEVDASIARTKDKWQQERKLAAKRQNAESASGAGL